ncbi:MAG: hypothetical protein MUD01_08390 [Chloroflexaceae bacterium]|nr:hypothetical protein [Chloroflexaceae bacterium]
MKPSKIAKRDFLASGKGILIILLAVVLIFLGWCVFVYFQYPELIRQGQFEALFGGLNSLFSALAFAGLIFTIFQQQAELELQRQELAATRKELRATAEANQAVAQDSQSNALSALYQQFNQDDFIKVRLEAWQVLTQCIKHKDYCDFVIHSLFASGKWSQKRTDALSQKIHTFYPQNEDSDLEDAIKADTKARHSLGNVMNFYNMLSLRKAPKAVFERCEFYYDWWRPLLWWFSDAIFEVYNGDPDIQAYCREPKWDVMLLELDRIYGFATPPTSKERWIYFENHPVFRSLVSDSDNSINNKLDQDRQTGNKASEAHETQTE